MKKDYVTLEKMKYKKNSLPYGLVLLGLVMDVFYFIALYKNNSTYYYELKIGLSIIYNLIFMLIVFLSAENIKNYHISFSVVVIIVGIFQIARIFYLPLVAHNDGELSDSHFIKLIIYLATSAVFLISGGIISVIKSKLLHNFVNGKIDVQKEEKYEIVE